MRMSWTSILSQMSFPHAGVQREKSRRVDRAHTKWKKEAIAVMAAFGRQFCVKCGCRLAPRPLKELEALGWLKELAKRIEEGFQESLADSGTLPYCSWGTMCELVNAVSNPGCVTAGGTEGFAADSASPQIRRSRMSRMVCLQTVQDVQVIRNALG